MKKIFLLLCILFNFIHAHNVHSQVMDGISIGVKAGAAGAGAAAVAAAVAVATELAVMPVITGSNYPAILAGVQGFSVGVGVGVAVRTAGVAEKKRKAAEIAVGAGIGWTICSLLYRRLLLMLL